MPGSAAGSGKGACVRQQLKRLPRAAANHWARQQAGRQQRAGSNCRDVPGQPTQRAAGQSSGLGSCGGRIRGRLKALCIQLRGVQLPEEILQPCVAALQWRRGVGEEDSSADGDGNVSEAFMICRAGNASFEQLEAAPAASSGAAHLDGLQLVQQRLPLPAMGVGCGSCLSVGRPELVQQAAGDTQRLARGGAGAGVSGGGGGGGRLRPWRACGDTSGLHCLAGAAWRPGQPWRGRSWEGVALGGHCEARVHCLGCWTGHPPDADAVASGAQSSGGPGSWVGVAPF